MSGIIVDRIKGVWVSVICTVYTLFYCKGLDEWK